MTPWIDSLPDSWEPKTLKRVARIANSNVDKLSDPEELPVRLCNYTDVYKNEFVSPSMPLMRATASRSEIARFRLQRGDVIITKDSEAWDDIGVPACVTDAADDFICGYHLTLLRPISDAVDGRYLMRAIQASGVREQFHLSANGVTRFGLTQQGIRNVVIPVPPLTFQRRIADFLDRKTAAIDGLIEKKERLIALLEEKRQALITQAVTKGLDPNVPMKDSGIEWLGKIPAHWDVPRLKHLSARISKGTTPSTIGEELVSSGIRFVKAENITASGRVASSPEFFISPATDAALSRSRLRSDDILVVIAGATTGKSAVLQSDLVPANTNQAVCFVRLRETRRASFVQAWLATPLVAAKVSLSSVQSAQPNLSMEDLGNIHIPSPPSCELARLTEHLNSIQYATAKPRELLGKQLVLLREYRQALISEAVTGKLDVTTAS